MKNRISHNGIVESIISGNVTVRIVQSSACSGCKIASHCSSSESKEKLIHVKTTNSNKYSVGDSVIVTAAEGVGMKAVFFAFCLPIIIMMATIITEYALGQSEAVMGISALVSLVPYYFILYILRGYFEKTITFSIE